ncbi:cation:dicarboxylate symporter family transporter [Thalassotalea hakodatensis]|uniref:cation:dicarboxylate symporter family transporter n=1 Tax=Thalassotalea hakodatensis TaxID=3030492 RepID=UPI002572FE8B|nr:cation:dicarboxylase symporter family transporter [Thalassotalea hakodatensis]
MLNPLKLPLAAKILIAMFLGLAFGSQYTMHTSIDSIANGFVMLLQMTALPYIALALIVGIGGLSPAKAKSTLRFSVLVLLGFISISVFFILLTSIAFPDWENASFYSASTIKPQPEFSFVELFIPANPFSAFANGVIPAVVLFSLLVGVGLMTIKGKRHTLLVLTSLQTSLANIASLVMKLAPIGIFCIGYRAAATLDPSLLEGLTVYIVTTVILVILLGFIIFPATVAIITPFSYRQTVNICRVAMITAFATGSFFAVLPAIIEHTKKALAELEGCPPEVAKIPGIIVPIVFSLPVGGKLLALLFTLFSAWLSGAYISTDDYFNLIIFGVPQLFSNATVAIPSLLELFNVSSAMFELFLVAENLIIGRLSALLSVSFAVCFPLIIACHFAKRNQIKWRYLIRNSIVIPLIAIASFMVLKVSFEQLSLQYQGYDKFIQRDLIFTTTPSRYLTEPEENISDTASSSDVLTRIQQRGFIRVGYFRDDLPYSFHNDKGKLVGHDIEIINLLAADLNVDIEYVRIFHHQTKSLLASGYLDITTGIPVIPDNMKQFTLTKPYSTQPIALLVKSERREEFTHWQKILDNNKLIIGIPETFFYKDKVQQSFVTTTAWEISTPRLFFKEKYQHIDAMLFGAAAASGWTLLHPDYTVVVPKPVRPPIFMAFPINRYDHDFEQFMANWIAMKKQNGTLSIIFDYWIEGKKASPSMPINALDKH